MLLKWIESISLKAIRNCFGKAKAFRQMKLLGVLGLLACTIASENRVSKQIIVSLASL